MEGFIREVGARGKLGPMKWATIERTFMKIENHAPSGIADELFDRQNKLSSQAGAFKKAMTNKLYRLPDEECVINLLDMVEVTNKQDELTFSVSFTPASKLGTISFQARTNTAKNAWMSVLQAIQAGDKATNRIPLPRQHRQILLNCILYLEKYGVEEKHIFRTESTQQEKYVLQELILINGAFGSGLIPMTVPDGWNPHIVANLLKQILRRLPESLLTTRLVPEFLVTAEGKNPGEIKSLLSSLPPANRILLDRLLQLCERIVENEEKTKMSPRDLGITLGPNFLSDLGDMVMLKLCSQMMPPMFEFLISRRKELFEFPKSKELASERQIEDPVLLEYTGRYRSVRKVSLQEVTCKSFIGEGSFGAIFSAVIGNEEYAVKVPKHQAARWASDMIATAECQNLDPPCNEPPPAGSLASWLANYLTPVVASPPVSPVVDGEINAFTQQGFRSKREAETDRNVDGRAFAVCLHEAIISSKVSSKPGVIPFRGASFSPNQPFLVFDLAPGGSLKQHLSDKKNRQVSRVVGLLIQAARALCSLHDLRVVHRDVTSRNFLLGLEGRLFAADFGISRELPQEQSTGIARGGPFRWMAPEALEPANVFSFQTDVYMFGMLAFECFTGRDPFSDITDSVALAKAVQEQGLRPDLTDEFPAECSQLIRDCWDRDPGKRPSMRGIHTRLRQILQRLTNGLAATSDGGSDSGPLAELKLERARRIQAEAEVERLKVALEIQKAENEKLRSLLRLSEEQTNCTSAALEDPLQEPTKGKDDLEPLDFDSIFT